MQQVSQGLVSDAAWKRGESILASSPGPLCHPAATPLPSLSPLPPVLQGLPRETGRLGLGHLEPLLL